MIVNVHLVDSPDAIDHIIVDFESIPHAYNILSFGSRSYVVETIQFDIKEAKNKTLFCGSCYIRARYNGR